MRVIVFVPIFFKQYRMMRVYGSRDVLVERRTRGWKVASSNPGQERRGIFFFSRVNFLCWLLFGVRCTPLLPQWHVKKPGQSAKSADGRLHLNEHTPLTERSRDGLTMPLSRHSEGRAIGKRAHTQLVKENSTTVVSARWATVERSGRKEWN